MLPDGSFTYAPVFGFNGTDQFTYTASDGLTTSQVATVSIDVVPLGQPPVAQDDLYHTERNTALMAGSATGVLANDSDADGDLLVAALDSLPAHGTLTFGVGGAFYYVPQTDFEGVDQFTYLLRDPSYETLPVTVSIVVGHPVIGRHVAYNNSALDGFTSGVGPAEAAAIAPDKTALLPGQSPAFANYTSFAGGINAVVIDVYDPGSIDLAFQMTTPDGADWQPAPTPSTISVAAGAGTLGADRVTVLWPDGAIVGRWLQTTLRATAGNRLSADDVFYFGNAVGETGNDSANALVTAADVIAVRDNPRGPGNRADVANPHDVNRDRLVDAIDLLLTRNHVTGPFTALRLALPSIADPPPPEAEPGTRSPFAATAPQATSFSQPMFTTVEHPAVASHPLADKPPVPPDTLPAYSTPCQLPTAPDFNIDRSMRVLATSPNDPTWPTLIDQLLRPLAAR